MIDSEQVSVIITLPMPTSVIYAVLSSFISAFPDGIVDVDHDQDGKRMIFRVELNPR